MAKDRFLALLRAAFESEYNEVFLYLREAQLFRDKLVGGRKLGALFEEYSRMELRHADRIAMKIIELGGEARWHFRPLETSNSLREVLRKHGEFEAGACRLYGELLAEARDADFKLVLKGIQAEEKEHLEKVTSLLESLNRSREE